MDSPSPGLTIRISGFALCVANVVAWSGLLLSGIIIRILSGEWTDYSPLWQFAAIVVITLHSLSDFGEEYSRRKAAKAKAETPASVPK